MNGTTQVYVVTSGEYSGYGINSIWLTYEEALAAAGTWGCVEVWPVGENQRTRGSFFRSAQVNYLTGEVDEEAPQDFADIPDEELVHVLWWPDMRHYKNQLGIRVTAETQERADKIYSEVRARVLAEISMGLPPVMIADSKYDGTRSDPWVPTARATS